MSETTLTRPADPGALAPSADVAVVAGVADTMIELMRSFTRARARILAAAEHDVEWSAHVLLKIVYTDGPMRAGAVADSLQSDPSTVSRQVAALVKEGLLERRADQHDGRASLLVVTARGEDVLADHNRIRLEYFARMLADWDEQELRDFAGMLRRFTDDYETASAGAVGTDDWIKERLADGAASAIPQPRSTTR